MAKESKSITNNPDLESLRAQAQEAEDLVKSIRVQLTEAKSIVEALATIQGNARNRETKLGELEADGLRLNEELRNRMTNWSSILEEYIGNVKKHFTPAVLETEAEEGDPELAKLFLSALVAVCEVNGHAPGSVPALKQLMERMGR